MQAPRKRNKDRKQKNLNPILTHNQVSPFMTTGREKQNKRILKAVHLWASLQFYISESCVCGAAMCQQAALCTRPHSKKDFPKTRFPMTFRYSFGIFQVCSHVVLNTFLVLSWYFPSTYHIFPLFLNTFPVIFWVIYPQIFNRPGVAGAVL